MRSIEFTVSIDGDWVLTRRGTADSHTLRGRATVVPSGLLPFLDIAPLDPIRCEFGPRGPWEWMTSSDQGLLAALSVIEEYRRIFDVSESAHMLLAGAFRDHLLCKREIWLRKQELDPLSD